MTSRRLINVRVQGIRYEAEDIFTFELRPAEDTALPSFTAGAHTEILMQDGLERSYSLVNPQHETHRYVVAVARDPQSRGGSKFMCDTLRPGQELQITAPSNDFELDESAAETILIAGGIGITPIWSMLQRLQQINRSWKLFYTARTRKRAAFLAEILEVQSRHPGRVHIAFDQEPQAAGLNLETIVREQPPGAHFYACGPAGLLKAFEMATASLDPATVHVERFASEQAPAPGGFEVTLAKSRRTFLIPVNKTILEVLLSEGVEVSRSCMEGVCGTCETPVLEGIPDHRDSVLSRREREANKMMMICCSGSKTSKLVLDL
ncbi:PDR/VanB family oxidoreductase [Bradyrhizobium sp. dw_411]|uniref:PDR/VanB family oxidoreductase n=1 Tax=Bradyrhizobium sp. dw_411 TaxID=2720082 RepID=UPI001BCB5CDB|nr:PDR/VanB family oxidoreductase [Bradyrhizobium sp. dw_411]